MTMQAEKDKRFIRYWNEQREGGKWSYILTYTIGGGVILFFMPLAIVYILSMLNFFTFYKFPIWMLIIIVLLISFAGSQFFWHKNEDRWRKLTGK